jgi:hypothetical protein
MNTNALPSVFSKTVLPRAAVFVCALFTAFAATVPADADASTGSGIQDSGGFFSEKAKSEANALIQQTTAKFRKDLRVETFSEIPAAIRSGVNLEDKAATAQMYEKWARQEAAERRVNGVYVLLVKSPSHLHAVVGKDTLQKAFTATDRDALVAIMLGRLREKKSDAALLEGSRFFAGQIALHAASRPQQASASPFPPTASFATAPGTQGEVSGLGWLPSLLIVAIVGMLILRLIGGLFGSMSGTPSLGAPSGGGFFRSMLGGLFGAAAGMWLYDQFFGHSGGASAWGSDGGSSADSAPFGDAPTEYRESDYSGSGGDFGDDNSGFGSDSDFGSGGDFGGGSD